MVHDDAVLAANRAFYEAFERRDFDAMSDLWEHGDHVWCTHPGWQTLHGWARVSASWYALFNGGQRLQFIVTNEVVGVAGTCAWVTCDENILGEGAGGTVAATNLFVQGSDGGWRLVGHTGSVVARRA